MRYNTLIRKITSVLGLLLISNFVISSESDKRLSEGVTPHTQIGNFPPVQGPALGPIYTTAIGLRAGETSGLTIKHFIGGNTALEGIVGLWHHGINLTALYEKHTKTTVPGLLWYYGAGGHIALQTNHTYYGYGHKRHKRYNDGNFGLGIDGIVGIEYKIPEIPIALSIDFKPYLEIISNGNVWGSLDPGLGLKFTL